MLTDTRLNPSEMGNPGLSFLPMGKTIMSIRTRTMLIAPVRAQEMDGRFASIYERFGHFKD